MTFLIIVVTILTLSAFSYDRFSSIPANSAAKNIQTFIWVSLPWTVPPWAVHPLVTPLYYNHIEMHDEISNLENTSQISRKICEI